MVQPEEQPGKQPEDKEQLESPFHPKPPTTTHGSARGRLLLWDTGWSVITVEGIFKEPLLLGTAAIYLQMRHKST